MRLLANIKNYFDRTPKEWAATLVWYLFLTVWIALALFILWVLIIAISKVPLISLVVAGFALLVFVFHKLQWALRIIEARERRKYS